MHTFLILALLVALLAIVFTLQNMAPVTVVFLIWTFHGSLALILFLALAAGAMICVFAPGGLQPLQVTPTTGFDNASLSLQN